MSEHKIVEFKIDLRVLIYAAVTLFLMVLSARCTFMTIDLLLAGQSVGISPIMALFFAVGSFLWFRMTLQATKIKRE